MKIIALGDLHGSFSLRLRNAIRKEDPNLIICNGDLPDIEKQRKLIFKYWDKLDEHVTRKEYDALTRKSIMSMEKPLQVLNSFKVPVVLIWGNADYTNERNHFMHGVPILNKRVKKFSHINFVARQRSIDFGEVQILAFSGYRYPSEKGFYKDKFKDKSFRRKVNLINKTWENRLSSLFSKISKDKTSIFLCHDPPKGVLDKVLSENPMKGKNLGDEYYLRSIKRFKPNICICGHMHEHHGKRRVGKTLVVNTGAAHDLQFAVIENKKVILKDLRLKK